MSTKNSAEPPYLHSPTRSGFQSWSTPNLPKLRALAVAQTDGSNDTAPLASSDARERTAPTRAHTSRDLGLKLGADLRSHSPASSTQDDGSEEEDVALGLPPRPRYGHHLSRSHTHLGTSSFAPPFYNRPPTPLPPSPSLTSLLRPTFSSQNSRPATPDPSSDEASSRTRPGTAMGTGSQTPNSTAVSTLSTSFRTAKIVARASPRVPTYEYYGFTLYLTSSLVFVVYVLWSFLPSPFLHSLGIYYYPNRWWALAIPAWTVMLVVYIYVALAAYNTGHLTLPLPDIEGLVDEAASIAVVDETGKIIRENTSSWRSASPAASQVRKVKAGKKGGHSRQSSLSRVQTLNQNLDWKSLWNEGTDAVMDIPLGGVCEILYGQALDAAAL